MQQFTYDALLFDLDGVLLDSEPLHFEAWRRVLAPWGIDLDWDAYRTHCIGVADQDMLQFLAQRAPQPVSASKLWEQYPEKNRLFIRLIQERPPVPPELDRALERLHERGLPMAVVSSSGRADVLAALEAAKLKPFFRLILCREDVRSPKPDPEPYLKAAALIGASRPLVFEDSQAGLESARRAGFDVIQVREPAELPPLLWRLADQGLVLSQQP